MADTKNSSSGPLTAALAAGVPDRNVKLAYGEKQIVGGVEVIPVAFVTYGFGAEEGAETGGGGGGVAIPLGAYIGGPDGLRFRPNSIALLAVAIPVISTIGWAIARIVKAAK